MKELYEGWRKVRVKIPANGVTQAHFEAPPDERVRGFLITPDHLYVESILVGNTEQKAEGQPPIPARVLNGGILDMPRGPITLRLRNRLLLEVDAIVRAMP